MADLSAGSGIAGNSWRTALRWMQRIFTPLSLLVIAWFIWQSRATLGSAISEARPLYLLFAFLLWTVTNVLAGFVGSSIFRATGSNLSTGACLTIHCRNLPAKYLPGGIWHSVGRANDYLNLGHGAGSLGFIFIVENVLLISVSLSLGCWLIQPLIEDPALSLATRSVPVVCIAGLLLAPRLARLLSSGKWLLQTQHFTTAVLLMGLYWLLAGASFVLWLGAFPTLEAGASTLETMGIYIFSWCVGYIAVFAPQGIGVAEFVSAYLLDVTQAGALIAVLAGFRLVVLAGDLTSWGICLAFRRAT